MSDTQETAAVRKDYKDLLSSVTDRFDTLKTKWHDDGDKTWKMYVGEENVPFNILYSNTETIVPAVFSKKPIPRVLRRHDESRADVPAKVAERMLSFCLDTNLPSYPSFTTAIEDAVLDAAIPGQGQLRVRLVGGIAVLDYVEWNKFVWGYCTRWESCPWVGFAHDLTPAEVVEQFGDKLKGDDLTYFQTKSKGSQADSDQDSTTGEKKPHTVRVWEIWDKKTRMQHWLCDCAQDCCLDSVEAPLKLEGFFPVPPRPLNLLHSTTDTMPRPLYKLYQQQAEELNEITRRLTKIVKAIKVRGLYASGLDDITKVVSEDDDNVFVPSSAASNIVMQGKGLDAFIWMMPIEKLILAAKELYSAREMVKQTIYEILGIGDILRGVTKASETLGAQKIKAEWGSLRINKARERVVEFIRDGLRLLLECAAKNTDEQTWMQATGVPLKTQMEANVMSEAGQKVPPVLTWPGVLGILQNDLQRAYLIDIESNSSVDSEATQEKAEMAEFMNAFGQTMAGLKEIMLSGPEGWEAGKQILIGVCAKFDLGSQVEPVLRQLKPPQQGANPEEIKKKMAEVQQAMQKVGQEKQKLAQEDQTIKDAMIALEDARKGVEQQKKDLEFEKKNTLREIEHARDKAVFDIQKEQMNLERTKMAVTAAGQQAVAGAKNAQQNAQFAGKQAQQAQKNAQQASKKP